ncbi:hypothetical protein SS1G_08519 [Sclerotinia sclerotiorum 1980 UF-70]|uniref:Ergothioneine biosynthesis protein 1 n=1 Tax=Sclerotinia sclerotiorum (strain ATCC 18683 / 1980 / Ss-1) TaxID=665079 RepID=A7ET64_SCLS1|nr:hypothetical protein SS1G_08519 [Sclerotinia sclerotiorum 1980 UF-70]EDN92656.1 hypothetical protein SS1G_08519 [Sclerotinia sclerotiorum 1980 UF-70]
MTVRSASKGNAEDISSISPHVTKVTGLISNSKHNSNFNIIDIRHDGAEIELKDEILASLRPKSGLKSLPTLLLYSERGLQIYEEVVITYLSEYYLTNAEIDVLERSAESIASNIPSNSMVVELGSGNLRKVSILLRALDAAGKSVDYFALDLSLKELERTLEQVPEFKYVKCHGLLGEYVYDTQGGRHQAFYSPSRDITIRDVLVKAGERVKIEVSLKYSSKETAKLLKDAGLREAQKWSASTADYNPDVDNPEQCHAHSEIPDEWPPLEEILSYQEKVREKVAKYYASQDIPRNLGRALWLGFEHEAMHLETLLYMLLQSDKTIPPTSGIPDFKGEAERAEASRVPNEWFNIPEQEIVIGLDDPEDNSGPDNHFGCNGSIGGASPPPLTKAYLTGKAVRTIYGLVPLEYALDWPVFASYDELSGCASWMGGRIPTVDEVRSIYSHVDGLNVKKAERHLGKTVPAVNGHLINEGVEETPPSQSSQVGGSSQELFTDLEGANVGFKNWHPISVTAGGNKLAGRAEMGGVWEWTSSVLSKHEGFEPMPLYPAYTADFFDGKHNVVLGGSWATHPRIAGRKTFVNWYQRNYPYTWAGARLVRDL